MRTQFEDDNHVSDREPPLLIDRATGALIVKVVEGSESSGSTLSGNSFSAATVNGILALLVAEAGFTSGTVDLSGGTNAAPTGQGITDKATLITRGVTVTTN